MHQISISHKKNVGKNKNPFMKMLLFVNARVYENMKSSFCKKWIDYLKKYKMKKLISKVNINMNNNKILHDTKMTFSFLALQ